MKQQVGRVLLLLIVASSGVLMFFIYQVTYNKYFPTPQDNLSIKELRALIRKELKAAHGHSGKDNPSVKKPRTKKPDRTDTNGENLKNIPKDVPPAETKLSSRSRSRNTRERFLVLLCDNTQACSGWGDRQRGVVAAFLLAHVTNRTFVLHMTSPCNINKFLTPNKYNWDRPLSVVAGKTNITIGTVRSVDYHQIVRHQDVNVVFPQEVIYLRSNSDLINHIKANPIYKSKIPKWANATRSRTFKNGWDILMKPSSHLNTHIHDMLKVVDLNKPRDLICAHIRVGQNPSLPNDTPDRNDIQTLPVLWDFLEQNGKNATRIFIATDSSEVRMLARRRFGKKCLDSGGRILHIDRQRKSDAACDGFETAILEQVLLTKCHVLVISASNFSIRGAFIRGIHENVFMFKNGTVKVWKFR